MEASDKNRENKLILLGFLLTVASMLLFLGKYIYFRMEYPKEDQCLCRQEGVLVRLHKRNCSPSKGRAFFMSVVYWPSSSAVFPTFGKTRRCTSRPVATGR